MSRAVALCAFLVAVAACQGTPGARPVAPPSPPPPAPPVVATGTPLAVRSATVARGSALPRRNVPIERVLAEVAQSGRPGLLYFCASWCGFCSKMNRQTLSRPEVQAHLASSFVAVEYDVDTSVGRSLAQRYGARGYPTMVVVDASGEARQTIVGARDPQTFLDLLGARR